MRSRSVLVLVAAVSVVLVSCGDEGFRRTAYSIPGGDAERGAELITSYGCSSCHTIPGIREADATVGPPLFRWAERRAIAGQLPNEPRHLIDWIMDPQEIEPGTGMPDLDVTARDARHIAAYLYERT